MVRASDIWKGYFYLGKTWCVRPISGMAATHFRAEWAFFVPLQYNVCDVGLGLSLVLSWMRTTLEGGASTLNLNEPTPVCITLGEGGGWLKQGLIEATFVIKMRRGVMPLFLFIFKEGGVRRAPPPGGC